jgi:Outer membrane protein beta-barrel domain
MKKTFVTFLIIVSSLTIANGQFTAIGGGLAMSSGFRFHEQTLAENKSSSIGISLKSICKISEPFYISPSFTFFFPSVTKNQFSKQTISSLMFDVDGHYVLNPTGRFEFYGLAGLDILFAFNKYSSEALPAYSESDNVLGLNLGAGTYIKIIDRLSICGEAKYVFNNRYNQFIINAGVLLNIDRKNKHEKLE